MVWLLWNNCSYENDNDWVQKDVNKNETCLPFAKNP